MNKLQREGDFAEMGSSNPSAKKEYYVSNSDDRMYVEGEIESMLNKGWKCQGGISITQSPSGIVHYAQAMIKN